MKAIRFMEPEVIEYSEVTTPEPKDNEVLAQIAYAGFCATDIELLTGEMKEKLDMDYFSRKILIPEGMKEYPAFQVRPHHLDTNHHVNNGQYVLMAQEYLPGGFKVGQMRAEYKKQAVLDDVIRPKVKEENGIYTIVLESPAGDIYAVVELEK